MRLLAERVGLELLKPEEVARLRDGAAEADRLRKKLKNAQTPPPNLGSEYQEGRYAGLQQGTRMAEELIGIHRERRGEGAKGIEQARERELNDSMQGQTRGGTRYGEPAYVRSAASQWQLVLRQYPEVKRAQEALSELEALASAAGIEILPLSPAHSRERRFNP